MAITRSERTTKMTLRVETAADTYKNRILNYINPSATDAKFYEYGDSIASSLIGDTFDKMIRTDVATITDE